MESFCSERCPGMLLSLLSTFRGCKVLYTTSEKHIIQSITSQIYILYSALYYNSITHCSLMHNDVLIVNLLRVTIRTLPYFELEKIWDHFYYTNAPHLYSNSGLRFAVARCIATFLLRVTIRNILYFELEQIWAHFY